MADDRLKHWIKEVREALGLTQPEFAAKLEQVSKQKVSLAALQKWERGVREPRPRMKVAILELAPEEIRGALGLRQHALTGKGTGLLERIEALEDAVEEQAKKIRLLQQQMKGRAAS